MSLWLGERFKAAIQRETSQFIEMMKWDVKVREQASKVAEYMSVVKTLDGTNPPEQYRRANELSWELALWLPADIYRQLKTHLTSEAGLRDYSVLMAVRKALLGDKAGDLSWGEVILHAPGIAKYRKISSASET